MKNGYHGWINVDRMDIDAVANLIVTGRNAAEANPDFWIFPFIGDRTLPISVLDFGCGFGRNTYPLAMERANWDIVGYDSEQMLARIKEFVNIKYAGSVVFNLRFESEWDKLKSRSFDCIYATIVLQHIYEAELVEYIEDFKKMTKRLIVNGRRFNDDPGGKSTWTILEEQGLIPKEFYVGSERIPYNPIGDPHDHNLAIYTLQ